MLCPPDDALARHLARALSPDEAEAIAGHLAACARCHQTLAASRALFATIEPAPIAPTPLPSARFSIERRIAFGGMGVVFEAHDAVLGRNIALKVLRPERLGDVSASERLVAEARALARVAHPNVVAVHDIVIEPGGVSLVLERVDGEDLAAYRLAAPSIRAIAEALADAARGLAAVHASGLVHGDVKPQNIVVGRDGRSRVIDFGLARLAHGRASGGGTPEFMAPEQLHGTCDARSDQYAFAITAVYALTGRRPSVTFDWSLVPRALVPPLARALEADRERRYPSIDAFLADFERAIRDGFSIGPGLLRANVLASLAMLLVHASIAVWFFSIAPAAAPISAAPYAPSALFDGFVVGFTVFILAGVAWFFVGPALCIVNAIGLARRHRWARVSTLAYASLTAITCFGLPYALFAWATLTRPSVDATLR